MRARLEQTGNSLSRLKHLVVDGRSATELAKEARTELLQLAAEWTGSYGVSGDWHKQIESGGRDVPLFLAGHQPGLFHPGVWFKNFLLSRLAEKSGAIGINLVIDNDIAEFPAVQVPVKLASGELARRMIHYDQTPHQAPVELQTVQDLETLRAFPAQLSRAIAPWVESPLVHRLWPHVMAQVGRLQNPGWIIAAGRHQLESDIGLKTLEVPLSTVCQTNPFHHFVSEIIRNARRFAGCYNRQLELYRERNAIRSTSHPVPPLVDDGEWTELPFWIYSARDPQRRRMLVCDRGGSVLLRAGGLPDRHDLDSRSLADQLAGLQQDDFRIRPRALMTTLFARMLLGDLFIHGIGGAVYDQITDRLAVDFFQVELPPFLVATATFRLIDWSPDRATGQMRDLRNRLRDLDMHPERHLNAAASDARSWIAAKGELVSQMAGAGNRRQRHFEMLRINAALRAMLVESRQQLEQDILEQEQRLARNQIVGSRELSICLHGEDLPSRLGAAADEAVAGMGPGG